MKRYSEEDLQATEARRKKAQNRIIYVHLGLNQDQQRRKNKSNGGLQQSQGCLRQRQFPRQVRLKEGPGDLPTLPGRHQSQPSLPLKEANHGLRHSCLPRKESK